MPARWAQVVHFVSATLKDRLDMVGGIGRFATAVAVGVVF
jgi:hypothetical protein